MAESTKLTGMEKYITERHQELSPDEVHQVIDKFRIKTFGLFIS